MLQEQRAQHEYVGKGLLLHLASHITLACPKWKTQMGLAASTQQPFPVQQGISTYLTLGLYLNSTDLDTT